MPDVVPAVEAEMSHFVVTCVQCGQVVPEATDEEVAAFRASIVPAPETVEAQDKRYVLAVPVEEYEKAIRAPLEERIRELEARLEEERAFADQYKRHAETGRAENAKLREALRYRQSWIHDNAHGIFNVGDWDQCVHVRCAEARAVLATSSTEATE